MPTRAPVCRRAQARLTATVDLPTPPLPDDTATTFLTPGMMPLLPSTGRLAVTRAVISIATPATPGSAFTARSA